MLFFLIFPSMLLPAETKLLDDGMPDDGTLYFKDETIESCHDKSISAVIQSCLIDLAIEKRETYTRNFNEFINEINSKKTSFFNYPLFIKLIKQTKSDWDKFIKNECLAEASTFEKGGFGYSYAYNQCLIKGYESRIKYYKAYQF